MSHLPPFALVKAGSVGRLGQVQIVGEVEIVGAPLETASNPNCFECASMVASNWTGFWMPQSPFNAAGSNVSLLSFEYITLLTPICFECASMVASNWTGFWMPQSPFNA